MKNNLTLILIALLSVSTYAQSLFKEGYFIDNSGKKTECLIQDIESQSNPINVLYKNSVEGPLNTADISGIKEFSIPASFLFIRHEVEIDISANGVDGKYSRKRTPEFESKTVFLEAILLSDKVDLFRYRNAGFNRFFVKQGDSVKQLIHKIYSVNKDLVNVNNDFRVQLKSDFSCDEISSGFISNVNYLEKDLIKYFEAYNRCFGSDVKLYRRSNSSSINLKLKLFSGLNFGSIEMFSRSRSYDITGLSGFNFGFELEKFLRLGDHSKNFSFLVGVNYHTLNRDKYFPGSPPAGVNSTVSNPLATVEYKTIEIPVGLRYYAPLNENLDLLADVKGVFPLLQKKSSLTAPYDQLQDSIKGDFAYGFGLGFQLGRFGILFRKFFKQDLFKSGNSTSNGNSYSRNSINFFYSLF